MRHKLHLIRGQRILNQLESLYETTFSTLRSNAKKIPAGDRETTANPVQVESVSITPYENSNILQVECTVSSESKTYTTVSIFENVDFLPNDEPTNVTFTGSDGETYNINTVPLASTNVKVRCDCLDFYWRFATYNAKDNSLYGTPPSPYQKKTNRPPVNPQSVPGVCKHLIKAIDELKKSNIVN